MQTDSLPDIVGDHAYLLKQHTNGEIHVRFRSYGTVMDTFVFILNVDAHNNKSAYSFHCIDAIS